MSAVKSAANHVERVLVVVVAVGRLFSLPLLVPLVIAGTPLLLGVVGFCVTESLLFITICLRRRRIPQVAAFADVAVTIAVLWPGTIPPTDTVSHSYNYLIIAVPVAGLAGWSFVTTLGVGAAAAVAVAATMTEVTWTVVPDIANPLVVTMISWLIATSVRIAANHLDTQREHAVAAASRLARERERVRQAQMLRGALLDVLEGLMAADAVPDEYVRQQLRSETAWLRRLVAAEPAAGSGDVFDDLQQLFREKESTGLRLNVRWAATRPELTGERTDALLGATREALTNVVKHAGVTEADVNLDVVDGALTIEVIDGGRGFDTSVAPVGVGIRESIQRRLIEVDGQARIESFPSRGTRVLVSVPVNR
ncbi:sensor histidine kinase [Kibdelosporangium persicum]|uniref:sensor histidine kinase n=1 Tax=Kibdelosporangium persicum TaxID=2698649 RepID=UPI001563BE4D|nr:ATP-binding protein [Kibdelosporangium persicum]